ncbi:hypothetical protein [Acinetobacter sp. GXMZU3951]
MKHQSGVTLISLLIGLLIAMLCIIALLSAYRVVVKTGVESRIAASHDTQLQRGLTTAQMFLQNAGFGLTGSNHLLTSDILINTKTYSALLWRYKEGSKTVCQGLFDMSTADNKNRQLVLAQGFKDTSGADCDATAGLGTFIWKVQSTLANLEDFSVDQSNPAQITFTQTTSACTPYGAGKVDASTQHPLITILAQTSTQHLAGLGTAQIPVCIVNISL